MQIKYASGRYPFVTAAALTPGDVVARPDGSLAIFDGLEGAAIGDLVEAEPLAPCKVVTGACKSADDVSAGDTLYWDVSEAEFTLTDTDNIRVGKAAVDAGTGVTTVDVVADAATTIVVEAEGGT